MIGKELILNGHAPMLPHRFVARQAHLPMATRGFDARELTLTRPDRRRAGA